ncbi:hypothetical protein M9Y10_032733 [Tritrichomonas musculus]|uniref:Rab-GAP TBC domain-containing protein n=1 Tax=Tritrichomonas musculus TaxID=1915356 RepID=A0ABR2GXN0_9EUKA
MRFHRRSKETRKPSIPKPSSTSSPTLKPLGSSTLADEKKNFRREQLFLSLITAPVVDLEKIRSVSWAGVPDKFRATVWRLFLDYEPVNSTIRESTLQHKRTDYFDCVDRVFSQPQRHLWTNSQKQTESQILRDLPRTSNALLRTERVMLIFTRILFTWSVRHPASGYVQGMNDLLRPFFFVFLADKREGDVSKVEHLENLDEFSDDIMKEIEADCFWCFSKLLDGLQDLYTKDQPGLYKMLDSLQVVIERVDPTLANHIKEEDIQYQEFAFRWMNCLLVREFSTALIFRLWDSYLSNHHKISYTHVYTCAALLTKMSDTLSVASHSDFVIQIQSIDPEQWTVADMDEIIAQAYVYERMFSQAQSHLRSASLPSFNSLQ